MACRSDAGTICDKADECGLLTESVDTCVDRIENLLEDKTVTDGEVENCAECYDDKNGGELRGGDCSGVCLRPFLN